MNISEQNVYLFVLRNVRYVHFFLLKYIQFKKSFLEKRKVQGRRHSSLAPKYTLSINQHYIEL